MKILFVLSQIEVTGAETYALALASALRDLGHEVVLVSETLRNNDGFKFHSIPLHTRNTSYFGRFLNVMALRRIIREEGIELIHSHSRAANLVAEFARRKIPMVVSVHGRWRVHFAARFLPCLGERTIAICPYLERYLADEVGIDPSNARMIPNGINTQIFAPSESAEPRNEIVMVARFSGQKGNTIRFLLNNIFPAVLAQNPYYSVTLVSSRSPADEVKIAELNRRLGRQAVKLIEWGGSLVPFYHRAAVVVGAGRVVMEAMSCGRPVVCIGESSAPGLLEPESFEKAFDSNFGDCGDWNLFEKEQHLERDLNLILSDAKLNAWLSDWGRRKALEVFDWKKTGAAVEQVYRELVAK